jgi:hypothetical protein
LLVDSFRVRNEEALLSTTKRIVQFGWLVVSLFVVLNLLHLFLNIFMLYFIPYHIFLCYISRTFIEKKRRKVWSILYTKSLHAPHYWRETSLLIQLIDKQKELDMCCILVSRWMNDWWSFSGSEIWFLIGCLQHSCFPFSFCFFPMRMIFLS